ncbi:MAG: hypothetical protein OEY52_12435 [Gammaproteobacteria bacterium]|nr:hypothetical protein [Gammaproteobacteria bacterium]
MKKLAIINLLVAIVVIILLGVAGAYLQKLVTHEPVNAIQLISTPDCDLSKAPCMAGNNIRNINLKLIPPINYLKKFDIELDVKGFTEETIERVIIDFSMTDMEMGVSRFELKQLEGKTQWRGFAILPVCISGRKDWQIQIFMKTNQNSYIAHYSLVIEG